MLAGLVLEERDAEWFDALMRSLDLPRNPTVPAAAIDVLRLLLARPEIERDDAAYLLRRLAQLETIELPLEPRSIRLALQLLVAMFEAAAQPREVSGMIEVPAADGDPTKRQGRAEGA
jgi:hypothetical protein